MMKQKLNKWICLLLCGALCLSGCGPADVPPPVGERAAPSPIPAEPREPEEAPALSYVQGLALERAEEIGLPALDGEEAVRAAYRYLVENVYFADPVGLDLWRYLSEEHPAIPYLENWALSPLLLQIGSCEDFAAALVLLLRAAGLEAEYVAGFTLSVDGVYIDHAWAVVELEGFWYHLDPQLEQNVVRGNLLTYRYYLLSDERMAWDHKWGENLIAYWSHMPEEEKEAIRREYTPPACPRGRAAPEPEPVPLPQRPNLTEVENRIASIKASSGKEELPYLRLNVEPPVLVAQYHVTPPLLAEEAGEFRYARSFLGGGEARLYDEIAYAVENFPETAQVPLPADLGNRAAQAVAEGFWGDHPELFGIQAVLLEEDGRRLELAPAGRSREELEEQKRELRATAAPLLEQAAALSAREAALLFHDHLAGTVQYVDSAAGRDSGNAYGGLVEGEAYCDGYARSFQYLCRMAGIPCIYIRGTSGRGIAHAWNAVKLEDGWHYVDVTWDRPMGEGDGVYHDYFLADREEMEREREWDSGQYPSLPDTRPDRAGYYEEREYAVGNGGARGSWEDFAAAFYKQLVDLDDYSKEWSPVFLEVKVLGSGEDYAYWKDVYVKGVFDILREMERMARREGRPFSVSGDTSVRCDFNDITQVLTFYPKIKTAEE